MKTIIALIIAATSLAIADAGVAQEAKQANPSEAAKDAPTQAAPEKPKPSREQLEAVFQATLTKARKRLRGRTNLSGPTTEERNEALKGAWI